MKALYCKGRPGHPRFVTIFFYQNPSSGFLRTEHTRSLIDFRVFDLVGKRSQILKTALSTKESDLRYVQSKFHQKNIQRFSENHTYKVIVVNT
jgi:hypothetical protein